MWKTKEGPKSYHDLTKIFEKEYQQRPHSVMPYAFVMSVDYAKILKEQISALKGSFSNFLGLLNNGMKVFALSNEKFKEICEKQPDVNDSNRMFVFDNPLELDNFMVKYNITEWAEIEEYTIKSLSIRQHGHG